MPALVVDGRARSAVSPAPHVFAIRAARDPQVMLRVAGLFAQRNIVPHQLCCRTARAERAPASNLTGSTNRQDDVSLILF